MKVTVCFGNVRVIVPCGSGDLLVRDLAHKAVLRYRKATSKPPDYWVTVHNLKSFSDGGILDPDDQLSDVADDREQIIAIYDEQDGPPMPHNGGDGTSASSVGTSSPEMFQGGDLNDYPPRLRHAGKNDVIITQNDLSAGSTLIVRRGSEPALNTIGTSNGPRDSPPRSRSTNRWSGIVAIDETKSRESESSDDESSGSSTYPRRIGGNGQERSAFSRFARDSARQSLASNSSSMYRWLQAQNKQEERYQLEQYKDGRKEPLGGTGKAEDDEEETDVKIQEKPLPNGDKAPSTPPKSPNLGTMIVLKNTGGPLGIHVVPDYDTNGRDMGLVIQGIEPGGRVFRDGRLQAQDRIIEINGTGLVDVDFNKAQDIFRQCLHTDELRLRVIKNEAPPLPKQPPPVLPKPESAKKKPPDLKLPSQNTGDKDSDKPTNSDKPADSDSSRVSDLPTPSPVSNTQPGSQPDSPSKKTPPAVPARHPSTALTSPSPNKPGFSAPNLTNTRKIGKKIYIQLTKGPPGLGFSVTTRDNSAGGNSPIYIKNILPKGAAIQDGNLRSGDRLLEVNGIEMSGKTQAEAVSILRNTKLGSVVNIVVSRQVVEEDKFAVPRELPAEKAGDDGNLAPNKNKEILRFNIPLNDSGSAGLGLSVKGKTTTDSSKLQDLGIFIKSIIAGGAASKDGRLKINDQLVEVNKESLLGKSNADAMESLRKAMQREGPASGFIELVVARRREPPAVVKHEPSPLRELRVSHSEPPDGRDSEVNKSVTAHGGDASGDAKLANTLVNINSAEANKPRNPLLDRLTGGAVGSNIRNESYIRATHDSLNETSDSVLATPNKKIQGKSIGGGLPLSSPTINSPSKGETVLIEGDNYQMQMRQQDDGAKARPVSTIGIVEEQAEEENHPKSSGSRPSRGSTDDGAPIPPDWLVEWDKERDEGDGEDLSPLDEATKTFLREGFGRQSMSEKRRGHVDPRISEFYRKMKNSKTGGRGDMPSPGPVRRAGSVESLLSQSNRSPMHDTKDTEFGPGLGLKKCSSLESLQTAIQEATQDDDSLFKHPNLGMVRGRGCNESFRAAVDRSYDDSADTDHMEPLEEESSDCASVSQGRPSLTGSARSSSFSERDEAASLALGEDDGKKGLKKTKSKKEKDKGGLFKGLGHMFRFGRHRKGEDVRPDVSKAAPDDASRQQQVEILRAKQEEIDKQRAKQREEQEKISEQYRKLQEKQRQLEMQHRHADHLRQQEALQAQHQHQRSLSPTMPQSRAERIAALRAEHQRRHRERHGQYPLEDQEELYERQMQELEKDETGLPDVGRYGRYVVPPRRHSEANYERPSSRAYDGPDHYSHYQNFSEIQAHLQRHQEYQDKYRAYLAHQQAERDRIMAEKAQRERILAEQVERDRMIIARQVMAERRSVAMSQLDPRYQDPHYAHRQTLPAELPPHWSQPVRSITPSSMLGGRASPSMRPRSQTPINQLGYLPHHSAKPDHAMGPPLAIPPSRAGDLYSRDYYDYDDPRTAYSEPHYGSLPRTTGDSRRHNGMISGPAQV